VTALVSPFGAIRQHESPYGLQCGQSRISVTYQKGSLVAHRRGSRLYEVPLASAKRSDLIFVGTFIGNEEYISPSDKQFAKTWAHNSRAFKQTLPAWSRDNAVFIMGAWLA